jgi:hypothetical protein
MSPVNELKARFPYLFLEPNLGISIAKGWFASFEATCCEIDQLLGPNKMGLRFP